MEKRIKCFDIAKGIGILCIIAGHMGIETIINIVFTFHVPLFFLISGFFISIKDSYLEYIHKRFRTLIVPYFFTAACLILIRIPYNLLHHTPELIVPEMKNVFWRALYASGGNNKTFFGIGEIGAIWFLFALFWSVLLVRFAITKRWGGYLIIMVALISYYSSKYFWLPFDLQAGGTASIFVYIGALTKKHRSDMFDGINECFLCSGLLSFVICYTLCIQTGINTNFYSRGLISVICSVMISCFVIYLSKFIEMTEIPQRILMFYGQNSIIILCFHMIEQNNFRWYLVYEFLNQMNVAMNLQHICIFIFKLAFATLCTWGVLKISFLRKIFMR